MRNAIQRLPKGEEQALVNVALENGLTKDELTCKMTRQHAEGRGQHPDDGRGILSGRAFNISYNLLLCEYCGNLMPSVVCPAKVLKIKDRLLNA